MFRMFNRQDEELWRQARQITRDCVIQGFGDEIKQSRFGVDFLQEANAICQRWRSGVSIEEVDAIIKDALIKKQDPIIDVKTIQLKVTIHLSKELIAQGFILVDGKLKRFEHKEYPIAGCGNK
jgi:hypothetical protein